MNYIRHLNSVFQQFSKDSRLNPTHVSLYMALFQYWNINRFPEVFFINREEVMQMAKIGSKATYHRCLRNLDDWKYILYLPSHNPYKGSQIKMLIFSTTSEQVMNKPETANEQALVSNTNLFKQITNKKKPKLPKNKIDVIDFFKNKKWPASEALKFYNHYEGIGWKLGGKIKIENWQATAENWMLKANEIETLKKVPQNADNLQTCKVKDYDQPL
ncbi:MAG: hypothetical protein COA50_02880 [Flavobacteriaceae bacterium]|nr:MAG: hypothetical protein COA50_02880 [Flavobacteriaceae bacterium]